MEDNGQRLFQLKKDTKMALKTVGNLKDSVSGLLTGLNLNNVSNLYGAFERAARNLIQKAYVKEATGRSNITLYDGVYDYSAPSNIFGGALVDLAIQGQSRAVTDYVYKRGIEVFDRNKGALPNGYMVSFEYRSGAGIMKVDNAVCQSRVILDQMSDSTKWTLAGTGTTSYTDETDYYASPASIRFNQTTGVSTLTRTLSAQSDLTDYEGVGIIFLAIKIPSSSLSSISVRLGSDSSNYFEVTETDGFLGTWIYNEWLLTSFDLANATETGTVDITKVDYAQIRITTTADLTNIRVGQLFVALGTPHIAIYTSPAIFSASGTISDTITNDADSIILQRDAYTLYEYECALEIALQQGGSMSSPLVQTFRTLLYGSGGNDLGLYGHYRSENPSERIMQINNWY